MSDAFHDYLRVKSGQSLHPRTKKKATRKTVAEVATPLGVYYDTVVIPAELTDDQSAQRVKVVVACKDGFPYCVVDHMRFGVVLSQEDDGSHTTFVASNRLDKSPRFMDSVCIVESLEPGCFVVEYIYDADAQVWDRSPIASSKPAHKTLARYFGETQLAFYLRAVAEVKHA